MLIDIHTHCSKYRGITRWNGTRYPTPEELITMFDERGIDRGVVLSTVSPEFRYCLVTPFEVAEICALYPQRLIPFCCVDPRFLNHSSQADFGPMLKRYKELGCKGVGEFIPNLPITDPLVMNTLSHIEAAGLPLTIHLAPQFGEFYGLIDALGLSGLEEVLKTFPDLVILGHSQVLWAEISADVNTENRTGYPQGKVTPGRLVELMSKYPNMHGDLSAGSGYNAISRDPEFGVWFLNEFQDRLYFGTDLANLEQETPIVGYLHHLKAEQKISPEVYEKVTHLNAEALLGLGE